MEHILLATNLLGLPSSLLADQEVDEPERLRPEAASVTVEDESADFEVWGPVVDVLS